MGADPVAVGYPPRGKSRRPPLREERYPAGSEESPARGGSQLEVLTAVATEAIERYAAKASSRSLEISEL
ncbi:MAG: hypothetical protein QW740_04805 [Sulfolobales archaeon]